MNDFILDDEFLDNVEKFTGKKFSQKSIIGELINLVKENNQIEKFKELTFTAKYVNGLFRSIKIAETNQQIKNIDQIKEDISENLKKVIDIFMELINKQKSSFTEKLEKNYLSNGQAQFENLMLLIDDLEQIKKYINYLKRTT